MQTWKGCCDYMKDNTVKNIYRFATASLLVLCVLSGVGKYIGMPQISGMHFIVGCLTALILALWCRLDAKGRMVLLLSVILALGVAVHGEAIWNDASEVPGVVLIAGGCFGICLLGEQISWVKVAVAGAFLVVLGFDLFGDRDFSHVGVVSILLYVVIVFVEWTEAHWKKIHATGKGHFMFSILPFLALYFVFMFLMPAPEEPYDWRFAKDFIKNVNEAIKEISRNWINRDREDFDFGVSGFDGDGSLLSGISDGNKTLMFIQGQSGLKTNVYLTGKIYDTFDGTGWESTNETTADERALDALETFYAVRSIEPEGEVKYIEKARLKIWYEDFRTEYLFAPLKTSQMHNLESVSYQTLGGNYVFNRKQGYGLEYQTTFWQLNVDHPMFYELLEKEYADDEAVFKDAQWDALPKTKYTLTDLDNHKAQIYETYYKPVTLSEESSKWLEEVTATAETDIEVLKAIEAALQQMTYTQTPGEMPDYVDSESSFLDYFLLESKQGFCVYYASAFVLLARAEGLPARYVEGFCVPIPGPYVVPVTSDMAHAWPEVYIEDMGWIPFEPTPGYSEIRYTPWEIQSDELGDGAGYNTSDEETDYEGEIEEGQQEETEEEEKTEIDESEAEQISYNVLRIIGFTILFAVLGGALVLIADRMLRRRRMKRLGSKERFKAEVIVNLRILAALGYERRDNETFSELRTRAWAIMDGDESEEKPEFLFLKLYEEYLYGEYPVKTEMLEIVSLERQYLMQMLKKWKPIMYIYLQFYYNIF